MISPLYYISQGPDHIANIQKVLVGGCKTVQLRVKETPVSDVLEMAAIARELCDQYDAKLIINDDPSIAVAVNADGVHLGLKDFSIANTRKVIGTKMIIGGTANKWEDIMQRVAEGVDYIGLGPYRFTQTKAQLSPVLGLDGFRNHLNKMVQRNIDIPVVAIGGILDTDVEALVDAGVYGVAVSRLLTEASDPKSLITKLNTYFHAGITDR